MLTTHMKDFLTALSYYDVTIPWMKKKTVFVERHTSIAQSVFIVGTLVYYKMENRKKNGYYFVPIDMP